MKKRGQELEKNVILSPSHPGSVIRARITVVSEAKGFGRLEKALKFSIC